MKQLLEHVYYESQYSAKLDRYIVSGKPQQKSLPSGKKCENDSRKNIKWKLQLQIYFAVP